MLEECKLEAATSVLGSLVRVPRFSSLILKWHTEFIAPLMGENICFNFVNLVVIGSHHHLGRI